MMMMSEDEASHLLHAALERRLELSRYERVHAVCNTLQWSAPTS